MIPQNKQLTSVVRTLSDFCVRLTKKLEDPNQPIDPKISIVSEEMSSFFSAASNENRVRFSYWLQKQIRTFLKNFVLPRLKSLKTKINDPIQFVQEVGEIWQNYQRFIFALKFVCHKADNTYKDFYKISVRFQIFLTEAAKNDNADPSYRNEICPIPVMAGSQLKQFLSNQNLLSQLTKKFVDHFCNFIRQERDGMNVPREKVNEVLQFFQSMSLDYDCDAVRPAGSDKLKIIKVPVSTAPTNRKSTANKYFDETFIPQIMNDCGLYYRTWIDTKALVATPSEEIRQMLKFLSQEEDRAKYYIHDPKNEIKYIETLENNLIEYKYNQRVQKQLGLKSFFNNYEIGNADMSQEILNFWNVYKRVYKKEQRRNVIVSIYQAYLKEEATYISQLIDKPPDFIEKTIALNKKNVQMLLIMQKPLELDRIRVDIFEGLLSMKFINPKLQGKVNDYFGAKHWAGYLNIRLKAKYGKREVYGEAQNDLAILFKLLVSKTVAINEHTKLLSSRLIDDIDMGMDTQYSNALDLESKILDEIKKETSENDIKAIQNCLKDIKNSYDQRSMLKQFKQMPTFGFFNQVIRKSGIHWPDTLAYDIQNPIVLRDCITNISQYYKSKNFSFVFELQNGTSLFTGKFKQLLRFQFKNIYMIILLLIDEQKNKKMFYTDITRAIKPIGGTDKTKNQLIKCLIELNMFGLLKTNRQFGPNSTDIWDWSAADHFQINLDFEPAKKLQCYKTSNLTTLPQYIKKAFQTKLSTLDEEEKKIQADRKQVIKARCSALLKFSQAMKGGKGSITFEELLEGQARQSRATPNDLKQILEHLINEGICERAEDKRNVFKYKS